MRLNLSGYVVLGIVAGLFCAMLIPIYSFLLIEREEVSNAEIIKDSRRVISWTLWSWGIILMASVMSTWGNISEMWQSGLYPTGVAIIIFIVLMIYRKCTI